MERARRVDQIFEQALDLPEHERKTWVRQRCGDDVALADEVLALLELASSPREALESRLETERDQLWRDMLQQEPHTPEDLSGTRVGHWLIVRRLARGGLGTVYLAERSDGAYRQSVALKALRRGLDTDDLVARFHSEREILSSFEHPGIAKLLDGGALPDGRPYLVLEYVDGLPITRHCEEYGLSVDARVALVAEVAGAIGHAHRRMVIHRDIKPSNVLVNSKHRVRVLDFGIAKLLDPLAMPAPSPVTRTGLSMLTPAYASPEQRAGRSLTTASDIYQLGMLLFELLAGERPDIESGTSGVGALPAPSQVAGGQRGRQLRGDLDAIVAKATHPDPERRYGSTDELIADLERYRQGLPVGARPESLAYRVKKLHRRKPWLLPALGLLGALVLGYIVTLSVYSARLAEARDLAESSQSFLLGLFKSPDPLTPVDAERGSAITVLEALDIGVKRAHVELAGQPKLLASLLVAISEVYASLDAGDAALTLRQEALDLERSVYGGRSSQAIASTRAIGSLYAAAGNHEKAEELLKWQLATAREVFSGDSPELGLSEIALGMERMDTGAFAEGQSLLDSGIALLRPAQSEFPSEFIAALIVSVGQWGMEQRDEALDRVAEAARVVETEFGSESLQATLVKTRLASTLTQFGDYETSERHFREAIPVLEAQLGETHSLTISALNNLGYLYNRSGSYAAAERIYRDLLERGLAKFGESHRYVADTYQNLASAITKQGRYDESIPLHWKAYRIFRSLYEDDNFVVAFPLLSIAYAELQRGHPKQAESSAREALDRFRKTLPGTFFEGVAQCLVGLSLEDGGEAEKGGALVEASHELMKEGSIPDPYPELCRLGQG